jgi:hypothetical protein
MSGKADTADGNRGEGATLSNEEIEKALQLAFEARDPREVRRDSSAMVVLRGRLDKIVETFGDGTLTREKAIVLLRAVSKSLKPATRISEGLVLKTHPAIELLDEFIDALADLGRGKAHGDLLATALNQAHRALSLKRLREDEALLKLVEFVKDMEGLSTKEAEERVAKTMRRSGRTRMGKTIDSKTLRSLRRHRKAKTPVARLENELFYRSEFELFY